MREGIQARRDDRSPIYGPPSASQSSAHGSAPDSAMKAPCDVACNYTPLQRISCLSYSLPITNYQSRARDVKGRSRRRKETLCYVPKTSTPSITFPEKLASRKRRKRRKKTGKKNRSPGILRRKHRIVSLQERSHEDQKSPRCYCRDDSGGMTSVQ